MTIEERAEKAVAFRAQRHTNCCQNVLLALADQTPLTEQQLLAAGSGFGGGMGNQKGTCGALVGAGLAAGLHGGGQPMGFGRAISEDFLARCGAVICRDLKQMENGRPLCACEDCIRNAVLAYGRVMGLE